MKRFYLLVSTVILLSLILSSCGGAQIEAPTEAIASEAPTTGLPLTELPVAISTPTIGLIDLAGPPMTVGSQFMYIDGSVLVAVPGGEFIMGYGGADNPEHKVTVSDFWIYRNEVTNQQFAACVAAGVCISPSMIDDVYYKDPLHANDPVTGVIWAQADSYCKWVHGRLPTEAEWEKAARGPDGNIYPWGDGAPTCNLLNYDNCVGKTVEVNKYPDGRSYYFAQDMAGNAFEWVADWYKSDYYAEAPTQDPQGPEMGQKRSVRSSGFKSGGEAIFLAYRSSLKPIEHRSDLGFRCVVEDPIYFAPFCQSPLIYGLDGNGNPIPGSDVKETCPTVNFNPGPYCEKPGSPRTNISPQVIPPDASYDPFTIPASCSGGPVYGCVPPGGTASVTVYCDVPLVGDPICPPGMTLSGDKCIGKGTSVNCPVGSAYDAVNKCCAPIGGTNSSFTLCPTGTYYADPPGVCVPYSAAGSKTYSYDIPFLECDRPDDGGCDPEKDPSCIQCPDGQTYQCVPNPQCPTSRPDCPLPPICGCQ